MGWRTLGALLLAFAFAGPARGDELAPPTRALKLGVTGALLVSNPYAGGSSPGGLGLSATYEFLLSPRFALGIPLGYRQHLGSEAIGVLVYGLLLKHYLLAPPEGGTPAPVRPYLQYGLLQQLIRQSGHGGTAVAYDAGLMAGADLALGPLPLFVEAAFHFSHLSFFDLAARNQSYLEASAGVRFVW